MVTHERLVDYTTIRPPRNLPWQFSVVLGETDASRGRAEVAVARLPLNVVDAQSRYAFDDLLQGYMKLPRSVGLVKR